MLPEAVKEAGAKGTILNHAEHKLPDDVLEKSIARAKQAGLLVMACAESTARAKKIASFGTKPDLIAIEPPELIGGNISVSTAKPEIISDTVRAVHSVAKIPIITGAGIKNGMDVKKSISLGCKGVFVASGIVKSGNQKKAIAEIISGFD
jgi:triosephosphate isomerase